MTTRRLALALGLLGLAAAPFANGQEAAERFIPVGRSPGLSGQATALGRIEAVDTDQATITVGAPAGRETARVTDRTRIWIDRSALRETNLPGSLSDCRVGRTAEIKFVDPGVREIADWVKVAVEAPPP